METSDSECFESADEDFESDDELNKNLTPIISKKVNLDDINKNEKDVETKDVCQGNTRNLGDIVIDNDKTTENIDIAKAEMDNKNNVATDGTHGESEVSPNKSDKYIIDDNLWNEDEGWGFNDEKKGGNFVNVSKDKTSEFCLVDSDVKNQQDVVRETPAEQNNMWENEEWETWETVSDEKTQEDSLVPKVDNNNSSSSTTWKGWGNWGVSSILSTATQSVSTLTNSVSQGISTVLENSIGAPDPEELAKLKLTEDKLSNYNETPGNSRYVEEDNKNLLGFGFSNIGNIVSGVSKLVESTSTKVISGGLDTLETIGKKTMEVIQEGDPGLKKKRAFLNLEGEKPVLSQVLREAKEKAEQENKILQDTHSVRKVNYESIFDDHQGLVHLEALEMLSRQCDLKLQTLIESSSGNSLTDIQETLDQVKELCELPDEEDDEQVSLEEIKDKLKSAVQEIGINIKYDKLISLWEETDSWLNDMNLNICDENDIHQQAVETLAQLTAIAVEQFHKAGELLLIKDHHSTADEADSLVQLTTTLTSLIGIVAAKFTDKMNSKVTDNSNKENINSLITNIFYEAANSSSYIQDAFQLLVPVLQMGAV